MTAVVYALLLAAGAYVLAMLEAWSTTGRARLGATIYSALSRLVQEYVVPRRPDRTLLESAPLLLLAAPVLALAGTLLTAAYVGRALRVLWAGTDGSEAFGGERWMAAALGVGVLLSASLGALRWVLPSLLEVELPESAAALALNLLLALAGLAAGWYLPARRLPVPLIAPASTGFRLGRGWAAFAASPILSLADRVARVDTELHSLASSLGGAAVTAADLVRGGDGRLHLGVEGIGGSFLASAAVIRDVWEREIEAGVFGLARMTRETGRNARRLQSGLVHQEMAMAVGGAALLVLLLAAGLIIAA